MDKFSRGNVSCSIDYILAGIVADDIIIRPHSNIVKDLHLSPNDIKIFIRQLENFFSIKINIKKFYPATVREYTDLVIANKDNTANEKQFWDLKFVADLFDTQKQIQIPMNNNSK